MGARADREIWGYRCRLLLFAGWMRSLRIAHDIAFIVCIFTREMPDADDMDILYFKLPGLSYATIPPQGTLASTCFDYAMMLFDIIFMLIALLRPHRMRMRHAMASL